MELTFNIINALGSLGTFLAFLFLFRRDKDKEKQLEHLTVIADTLKIQNESLIKQNDLIAQQIDIFRNTTILKEQNAEAIQRLEEIEKKKLKLSVLPSPRMTSSGYSGSSREFWISPENMGEPATVDSIEVESNDVNLRQMNFPLPWDKNKRLKIEGTQKGDKHIKDAEYKINIHLRDKLDNKYITTITRTANKTDIKTEETGE